MGTTRFQLSLITALAFALGLAVSSKPATGYPTGPVVSYGANPLWTFGGATTSANIFTSPEDQDMVITDLILTMGNGGEGMATLTASSGADLGRFHLQNYNSVGQHVEHQFAGGIRIPTGESVTLSAETTVYYSISGYYAQP